MAKGRTSLFFVKDSENFRKEMRQYKEVKIIQLWKEGKKIDVFGLMSLSESGWAWAWSKNLKTEYKDNVDFFEVVSQHLIGTTVVFLEENQGDYGKALEVDTKNRRVFLDEEESRQLGDGTDSFYCF